jgi:hypothetical protein
VSELLRDVAELHASREELRRERVPQVFPANVTDRRSLENAGPDVVEHALVAGEDVCISWRRTPLPIELE